MEWKVMNFWTLYGIPSVNSVIINRNQRDKLGSIISCAPCEPYEPPYGRV